MHRYFRLEERIILNQRYSPVHPKMEGLAADAMSTRKSDIEIQAMRTSITTHFDNTKRDSINMLTVCHCMYVGGSNYES